jgi:hypothetical protein
LRGFPSKASILDYCSGTEKLRLRGKKDRGIYGGKTKGSGKKETIAFVFV